MVPILLLAANLSMEAAACDSLQSLKLPDTTIISAALIADGPFTPPAAAGATQAPRPMTVKSACRIVGRITTAVNFEVWLPASDWNGKFQMVGGGGFAGVISYGAMAAALNRGYATASTDTGHSTQGGAWAQGHPELIVDFAYRAIHETTVKAKSIVEAFYGNGPRLSYFVGCSTGGRQGLMEAQRFPNDFNGVVAGAPANNWTHLMVGTLWMATAAERETASWSRDKFEVLNQHALKACDAKDGVTDGLIENPPACKFDPQVAQCTSNTEGCLTPAQVRAAKRIYSPAVNPKTKAEIFPGMAPGSELGWNAIAGPQPFGLPADFFKYFVYDNAEWDYRRVDFDKDVTALDSKYAAMFNAVDPDLSAFKGRGGKLIMYHGWNDQLIQPGNSINYYNSVTKKMGAKETDDFARLFMAPGMMHCAGGPGPNAFDAVTALEQWVEKGEKPAQMIASHSTNGAVDRTRPLCPYPQVATYKGAGSTDEAANFVCK